MMTVTRKRIGRENLNDPDHLLPLSSEKQRDQNAAIEVWLPWKFMENRN